MFDNMEYYGASKYRRNRRIWKRITAVLSPVVVLVTISALVLPGVTMTACAITEHQHTLECYAEGATQDLACTCETLGVHTHAPECYDEQGNLICGLSDFVVHTHDDACYRDGALVCTLPEIKEHLHDAVCYLPIAPVELHQHSDACYEWLSSDELVCGLEEGDGQHTHNENCYALGGELTCTQEETPSHTHGEPCYAQEDILSCGLEEFSGHTHGEGCYITENALLCGQAEAPAHTHGDTCYTVEHPLVCGQEEIPAHTHGEPCYTTEASLLCELAEAPAHAHGEGCYAEDGTLICELAQTEGHTHGEACYSYNTTLSCTQAEAEGHAHSGACYGETRTLSCTQAETAGHIHSEACYGETTSLVCTQAEVEGHAHGDACYIKAGALLCTQAETEGHTHGEACYAVAGTLLCTQEEAAGHIHDAICYANTRGELVCGEETPDPAEIVEPVAPELICQEPEVTLHTHGEECYSEDGTLVCTQTVVEAHQHSEECFHLTGELICQLPEHTHGDNCISTIQPVMMMARAPKKSTTDLETYVEERFGELTLELFDSSENKVENGSSVTAGEGYKLVLGVSLPENAGFLQGTYTYQFPSGVTVTELSNCPLTLSNDVQIGTWSVTEAGALTLEFNQDAENYTHDSVTISMSMKFSETDEPIDFDGHIHVDVVPSEESQIEPYVSKYGSMKVNSKGDLVIEWDVSFQGGVGVPLTGQTIQDDLGPGQTFNGADKKVWVNVYDHDGHYYSWEIKEDDPNVVWTDTAWTYTIPETIECVECSDPKYTDPEFEVSSHGAIHNWKKSHSLTLGKDWRANFYLESIPTDPDAAYYENRATVTEDLEETARVSNQDNVGIIKTGHLENGIYHWTIEINIPAITSHSWELWDSMQVNGEKREVDFEHVTAFYRHDDAGEWMHLDAIDSSNPTTSITYNGYNDNSGSAGMVFYNLCDCTAETCANWEGKCASGKWGKYCTCWHQTQSTQIRLEYSTSEEVSSNIISEYGGQGLPLVNGVTVSYQEWLNGSWTKGSEYAEKKLPIPGVFSKTVTEAASADNQYTALYHITLNEEFRDLSLEDSVVIKDHMTENLYYENGSMVVTQTDANGQETLLQLDQDYTITVTGGHDLAIELLHPGPYLYTLDYRCALDVSVGKSGTITYKNSATVTLSGHTYESGGQELHLFDYTVSAERFHIHIHKADGNNGTPMSGVVFGIFNASGGKIAQGTTDENGQLTFESDLSQGIIFCKNTPYYVQELETWSGYVLDSEPHWLYFATEPNPELEAEYPGISLGTPSNDDYSLEMSLKNYPGVVLPNTGGSGTTLYMFSGLALMLFATALMYNSKRKNRKEAR